MVGLILRSHGASVFLAGTAITAGFTRKSLNLYFYSDYIPKFLLFISNRLK